MQKSQNFNPKKNLLFILQNYVCNTIPLVHDAKNKPWPGHFSHSKGEKHVESGRNDAVTDYFCKVSGQTNIILAWLTI